MKTNDDCFAIINSMSERIKVVLQAKGLIFEQKSVQIISYTPFKKSNIFYNYFGFNYSYLYINYYFKLLL